MSASRSASESRKDNAPLPSPATGEAPWRYPVFLSYSHTDTKWACRLMRWLEGYRVPRRFHGRSAPIGAVGRRIAPVFRDRDELPTTSDLGETIRAALRASATLVVICSPAAARSRWVQEEIMAFKRRHGERRVFAFIVGGEPKIEGAADDCFSPALRWEVGADGQLATTPAEVVAADARPEGDGPKLAFVRLLAGLLGVGFDDLRQREQQRRLRRMTLVAAGSIAGMLAMLALAAVAWQARNDAQRRQAQAEDQMTFMLGDFWDDVEKIGRLALLDKVGQRATDYFETLDVRDATDSTLVLQATALTKIGENRINQAKYADASKAFTKAYERAAALVARNPANKNMLFERGRAEHWLGFTDLKRRQLASANTWFTRYRDTAVQLRTLDRHDPRGSRELIYAEQSLAVLQVEMVDYGAARARFLAERAALDEMLAAKPGDFQLRFETSVNESWLGVLAERSGGYEDAIGRFGAAAATLEALMRDDPRTARWEVECAERHLHVGVVLGLVGRRAEASVALKRAREINDPVSARDPQNRVSASQVASLCTLQAALALAEGDLAATASLLEAARRRLEPIVAAEPSSPSYAEFLARAWRGEAQMRLALGRADAADAVTRAIGLVEPFVKENTAGDRVVRTGLAEACVIAGRIAQRQGDLDGARRHWSRVVELVEPRVAQSNDWRLVVPAARALAFLGRQEESRALIDRLDRLGYRPLEPWPEASSHSSSVSSSATNSPN